MNVTMSRWGWCLAPAALAYGFAVLAQDKPPGYPARPIRIIISVAPGAGADMVKHLHQSTTYGILRMDAFAFS